MGMIAARVCLHGRSIIVEEWQVRVMEERQELNDKLQRLAKFIKSKEAFALNHIDFALLYSQESAMRSYLAILRERIERWTNA